MVPDGAVSDAGAVVSVLDLAFAYAVSSTGSLRLRQTTRRSLPLP